MTEFEKLVLDMRNAQKTFFRYHDQLDLRKSKELERRVDAWLERKKQQEQDPTPDLFADSNGGNGGNGEYGDRARHGAERENSIPSIPSIPSEKEGETK